MYRKHFGVRNGGYEWPDNGVGVKGQMAGSYVHQVQWLRSCSEDSRKLFKDEEQVKA